MYAYALHLLHSERSKLYPILAFLSAIGLMTAASKAEFEKIDRPEWQTAEWLDFLSNMQHANISNYNKQPLNIVLYTCRPQLSGFLLNLVLVAYKETKHALIKSKLFSHQKACLIKRDQYRRKINTKLYLKENSDTRSDTSLWYCMSNNGQSYTRIMCWQNYSKITSSFSVHLILMCMNTYSGKAIVIFIFASFSMKVNT